MKKLFVLSCVALATLASCSKSEDIEAPQAQKEIAFSVATDKSRAPIAGSEFPTSLSMYVSAYNSVSKDYFKNVEFKHNDDSWKAGMYWPINGVTNFLAYAFTPAADTQTTAVMNATKAKWGDTSDANWAQQVTFDFGDKSLCYAPATVDGSTVADPMTPYVDLLYASGEQAKEKVYTPVSMTFKHTGAWVVFNVKLGSVLTGAKVTLNSFQLAKLFKGGKVVVDNTTYAGAKASWDFSGVTAADYDVESFTTLKQLKADTKDSQGNVTAKGDYTFGAIIPEQNQTAIKFEYTLASSDEDNPAFTAQTATYEYPLSRFDKWEMGKKYTYNITITFNEITITPSVENWVDVPDGGNGTDVQI